MAFLRIFFVLTFCLSSGCQTKINRSTRTPPESETETEMPEEEDAFAKSVEEVKNEHLDFHQEFLDFKQGIANYKKSNSYIAPKTDEEGLMKMEADNMDNLTEEFLIEQIKENKFEAYNAKLKDMDKLAAQTQEVIEENFADTNAPAEAAPTPETTAEQAPVVAGTTEEQPIEAETSESIGAASEIEGENPTPIATGKKENKRTNVQYGTGIFTIVLGSIGVLAFGHATANQRQLKKKLGPGALTLLSFAAIVMGSMIVADENKDKIAVPVMQAVIGVPAAVSGLISVWLLTAAGASFNLQSMEKASFDKKPLKRIGAGAMGLLFAGLAVGLSVWVNKLNLENTLNDVETFQSKTARLYVIASHMDENNIDPTKPMSMPAR